MTRKTKSITIGSIVFIVLVLVIAYSLGVFGISANNTEQNARKSQKIESTWKVSKSANDRLVALLFYDDGLGSYTYSIYVNRPGVSFGYFFREGGSMFGIMDSVYVFTYDTGDSALLSMNKDGVAKIELDNGISKTQIDIDPSKPFTVVLPKKTGLVTLYDTSENTVFDVFMGN